MNAEIKIPAVGESITEATISQWLKKDGDQVNRDEILLTLETDKASVEVVAEHAGKLKITAKEGQTVPIGSVVGSIDTDGKGAAAGAPATAAPPAPPKPTTTPPPVQQKPVTAPPPVSASTAFQTQIPVQGMPLSPAVKRIVEENQINTVGLQGTGKDGRLTKGDVLKPASAPAPAAKATAPQTIAPLPVAKNNASGAVAQTRETMTKIRQTIAKRLVEAQHTAAILTTFNEIDMTNVMALRAKYKEKFKEKYNVNLGFMGFFVKASIEALKAFPRVNAFIEGNEVVFNHSHNIGIAVGTEKGLMVPVIRNAENLSIAEIEMSIKHYADKARLGKIDLNDLSGGTFTISNGGVYGSLMSTPILNPPQSAILGLHKIEERPVAIQGKVEIRPMMYVALSYDHRIIDGGESVSFLVRIKEGLEDPSRLLLEI